MFEEKEFQYCDKKKTISNTQNDQCSETKKESLNKRKIKSWDKEIYQYSTKSKRLNKKIKVGTKQKPMISGNSTKQKKIFEKKKSKYFSKQNKLNSQKNNRIIALPKRICLNTKSQNFEQKNKKR